MASRGRPFFWLIALLIPVAFFALIELGLRALGQRTVHPLFIASPGNDAWMQANPDVIRRFFAEPDRAPAVNIETSYFRKERPKDGLRLVVQGGSSAAGFPYGYGASIAGMLEQRLRALMTDRPVEVITTAMSAVNSYTLLDFADEVVAVEPDAVLIYAGHNEYLGVLGVGSALSSGLSPGLTRATLKLRRLALYQLVERVVGGIGAAPELDEASGGGTLMARVASQSGIAYGSPDFEQGVEQFRGNLSRLVNRYRSAGIPVIVATLAGNERDRAPFVSSLDEATDAAAFAAAFSSATAALDRGESATAIADFARAIELDEGAANAWYGKAQALLLNDDLAAAAAAFASARDRDQLRFRAPGIFNDVVRAMATRPGVTLADVETAMRAASADNIIGNELMLEHVHPNLDGYFLMADAFFDALFEARVLVASGELEPDATARAAIPVSEVDRLFGEYKLQRVLNDWPFVDARLPTTLPAPTSNVENIAQQMYHRRLGWPQAMAALRQHYVEIGDTARALHTTQILADALPFVPGPQFNAGTGLIQAGRALEAIRYLKRAVSAAPNDVNAQLALAHALVLGGKREEATARLRRVLVLQPGNPTATNALRQLGATP